MKVPFACIGLLIVMVFASGCVPIATGAMPPLIADTRGGVVPTATPTSPVSPLPTPTPTSPVSPLPTPTSPVSPLPTPTSPVSPLPTPAIGQSGQAAAPTYVQYVVRRGDTLAKIAAKFGVSMSSIRAANPSVTRPDRIWVGQRLRIPVKK